MTTVQTVTPEPQTFVTTVTGPTVTETVEPPARVVVVVDEGGNSVTTVYPRPEEGGGLHGTETVTVTLPASTVTEVPVTTTTTQLPPKDDVLGKCVANAVRSPILYMVPLLAIGNMFGEVAAPYVKAINDQFNEISAEIQDEIRRRTPSYDFGIHGGHDNEQAAELRAKVDAANRMLQELASRPDVQEYGKWAAIAMGVVVAGSVLYDWCTNEEGEALTAIGPKKTTTIDGIRINGSSITGRRGGAQAQESASASASAAASGTVTTSVTTTVPPVTVTPGRGEFGSSAGSSGSSN